MDNFDICTSTIKCRWHLSILFDGGTTKPISCECQVGSHTSHTFENNEFIFWHFNNLFIDFGEMQPIGRGSGLRWFH